MKAGTATTSFFRVLAAIGFLLPASAFAIPNTFFGNGFFGPIIPAMPVFGANLTEDFFEVENWEKGELPGPWSDEAALGGGTVRRMTANPTLFGAVPMSVYAYGSESGELREIAIHFLDAGLYFGYRAGGENTRDERMSGSERRSRFAGHYRDLSTDLRRRLEEGCGRGRMGSIGRSDALRTVFTEYRWEEFRIRFVARPGHSVSLHLMREGTAADDYFDAGLANLGAAERASLFASRVRSNDIGDHFIDGLPMFTQGNTPFCGIHSLAMAGHYLGLRVHPETLAAGAEFRNTGSARGSDMLGLYRGVGEEIGMRVRTSSRFDLRRTLRSIEAGLPVIVWRRVSLEREKAHNEFLREFRSNPLREIGEPSDSFRKSYPPRDARRTPSHASVVNGVNPDRREVIFTEPWGEFSRDRRMRVEEMEATVYAVFYFQPE